MVFIADVINLWFYVCSAKQKYNGKEGHWRHWLEEVTAAKIIIFCLSAEEHLLSEKYNKTKKKERKEKRTTKLLWNYEKLQSCQELCLRKNEIGLLVGCEQRKNIKHKRKTQTNVKMFQLLCAPVYNNKVEAAGWLLFFPRSNIFLLSPTKRSLTRPHSICQSHINLIKLMCLFMEKNKRKIFIIIQTQSIISIKWSNQFSCCV